MDISKLVAKGLLQKVNEAGQEGTSKWLVEQRPKGGQARQGLMVISAHWLICSSVAARLTANTGSTRRVLQEVDPISNTPTSQTGRHQKPHAAHIGFGWDPS